MGAIRTVVNDLSGDKEMVETQRELVESLASLAEAKGKEFELLIKEKLRTAGQGDNYSIPVEAVLSSTTYTHAYSKKDAGRIGDTVNAALKDFVVGGRDNVLNGIGSLITTTLTDFLGKEGASDTQINQYYALVENIAITRIDYYAWQLNVEAKSIQDRMQKVCAFSVCRSAVDLSKLKFGTFLSMYENQLAKVLKQQELQDEIITAAQIFRDYHRAAMGEASSSAKPVVEQ